MNSTRHTGDITERNISYNVKHGVASVIAANLASPFFGIFALKLGASNIQVALLSSAPAVVSLLTMIPGALYVDRFSEKKRVTTMFFLANRVFYLALACVPLFSPDHRAAALVAAVALMNLPGAIGNVAWQAFIAKVIPPSQRAQAFARRNRWMNLVGTAVVVVAGKALDVMSFPLGYQVMFVLAFVAAMVEVNIFQRIVEPQEARPAEQGNGGSASGPELGRTGETGAPRSIPGRTGLRGRIIQLRGGVRETVRDILEHPRFVQYTLASVVFYFMWQTAWPLFTLYQVKVLGANNLWVSLLNLANTGGALIGYGFWASFADRHGHMKTLVTSTMGMFFVPVYYALSHSLLTITVLNLVTGVIFSGVNLALFNALLEHTPEERTTTYIAYYNTAITLTSVFAPMAGVGLLKFLSFFWAFLVCALGRVIGCLCFYLVYRREQAQVRGEASRAVPSPGSTP